MLQVDVAKTQNRSKQTHSNISGTKIFENLKFEGLAMKMQTVSKRTVKSYCWGFRNAGPQN